MFRQRPGLARPFLRLAFRSPANQVTGGLGLQNIRS